MRWLLLKDLQILRRSPLLVALLIIYPLVVSVLLGIALSRGPEKPTVAVVNEIPADQRQVSLAGQEIDVDRYTDELLRAVEPIPAADADEARASVQSGEALAAVIIPPEFLRQLSQEGGQAEVEVIYNTEDPVKADFVRSTLNAELARVNSALSKQYTEIAVSYLDLLLTGGQFRLLGQDLNILGLQRSRSIIDAVAAGQPEGSGERRALTEVVRFADLAIQNLDVSDDVLAQVAEPITVRQVELDGPTTPLDAFAIAVAAAVSLMFVTVLLAAGMLALEREENAVGRLVRGLVSKLGLLAEKVVLAAGCAALVTFLMLTGIAAFVGVDWSRLPLWIAALAAAGLAFGALGVALGGLAREVRAASLLALMLSLPLAFLALVPEGAVSQGLYSLISVVSAIFPFKPALQALNAAVNDAQPGILVPVLHLLGLTLAFGAIARLALRRFAQ